MPSKLAEIPAIEVFWLPILTLQVFPQKYFPSVGQQVGSQVQGKLESGDVLGENIATWYDMVKVLVTVCKCYQTPQVSTLRATFWIIRHWDPT